MCVSNSTSSRSLLLSSAIIRLVQLSPPSGCGLSSDMAFLRVRWRPSGISLAGDSDGALWMVSTPTTLCLWCLGSRRPFWAGAIYQPWVGRQEGGEVWIGEKGTRWRLTRHNMDTTSFYCRSYSHAATVRLQRRLRCSVGQREPQREWKQGGMLL